MLSIMGENECIRVFTDAPNANVPPRIKHGSVRSLWPWIKAQNRAGGGIFFSVNQTDGKGARTKNITRIRAFYTDIDGLSTETEKADKLLELIQAPLPPSAIVSTSNGLHCYWYTSASPQGVVDYSATNLGIATFFGGDTSVKDLARVLRLPGTYHMKDPKNPYLIEILHDVDTFYREGAIREAYPVPVQATRPPRPGYDRVVDKPTVWGYIVEDLAAWTPQPGQRNLAMLLASGVAIKFGVPREDCFQDLLPIVESWGLNRDEYNELRRVTNWAYEKGKPTSVAALRNIGVSIRRLPKPRD